MCLLYYLYLLLYLLLIKLPFFYLIRCYYSYFFLINYLIEIFLFYMNLKDESDAFYDPAVSHPLIRYIIRYSLTIFFILLLLFIPGLAFFIITILLQQPMKLGMSIALLSFFCYVYYAWKSEIWAHIKR